MRSVIAILIASAVLGVRPVHAQSSSNVDAPRFEAWGAVALAPSGPTGTATTSYAPPLLFDGDFTSHAGQVLTVEASRSVGAEGGVTVFISDHAGLQLVVDRRSGDIAGINSPYAFTLNYVSRQPPDNLPVPVSIARFIPWGETTGSLTDLAFALNGALRVGRPDRVYAVVSAGPALHRLAGVARPIGFTTFRLGGHSVLFEDDFQIEMTAESQIALGVNAGADLNVHVARHAALVFGYRLFAGPDADVTLRPSGVLNPDDIGVQQTIDEIAARFPPATLRIPMTSSRLFVGVKIIG